MFTAGGAVWCSREAALSAVTLRACVDFSTVLAGVVPLGPDAMLATQSTELDRSGFETVQESPCLVFDKLDSIFEHMVSPSIFTACQN